MTKASALGAMPEWDLSDLYAGPDDLGLESDLDWCAAEAAAIAELLRGRIGDLDGPALGAAIARYEAFEDRLGRVMAYSSLLYQADTSNTASAKFYGDIQSKVTDLTTPLVFFTLEINAIPDDVLSARLSAPELARYRPWLDAVRAFRPHQLSDEVETLLHEKSVAGRAAWNRLFDETTAALRFSYRGETLTGEGMFDKLASKDGDVRRDAATGLAEVYKDNIRLLSHITNTLVKDKEIEDRWRKFAAPEHARHLANQVEPEVVDALEAAVVDAFPRLSHRYYAMKARWLGRETLHFWDRNAPLPDSDDRIIPWEEARETVLGAHGEFAPAMADVAKPFFEHGWIDAPVRPGKASGAFAHPTVPSAHPYVLLNYQGRVRDVMTLAHELGHGVHQVLAAPQGLLLADTPLTLAETASVFGEMLTFRRLLKQTRDPVARKAMLASKVEDMINTVVRQIAFYRFERRVHSERRNGELTSDQLGQIWLDVQRESLGPAITMDDGYEVFWSYIPHFVHSPFYVYAYAFGDCLVNSLYAVYENAREGFAEKYFEMLKAGGSKRHGELLAPFGLDATDPAFWGRGLTMLEGFIAELEAMDTENAPAAA